MTAAAPHQQPSATQQLVALALIPLVLVYNALLRVLSLFGLIWSGFLFVGGFVNFWSQQTRRIRVIERQMRHAQSYDEYLKYVLEHDALTGAEIWKKDSASNDFDSPMIESMTFQLKEFTDLNQLDRLAQALHSMASRNIGGIGNPRLYSQSAHGTKHVIERFIDQVVTSLLYIRDLTPSTHTTSEANDYSLLTSIGRYKFFTTLLNCYGRSVLMLSGGASLAMTSLGVCKALHEQGLLPKIITGTSGGAIVACVIASREDKDIPRCFDKGAFKLEAFETEGGQKQAAWRKLTRLLNSGVLMDIDKLQNCLRENIGDVTFEEAYKRTGRIINITVNAGETPFVLNHVTSPNVLLWSAACASCALPLIYKPVPILCKDARTGAFRPFHAPTALFSDGSFVADLPQTRVAELFNVNFSIVSQTNPYVVAFFEREDDGFEEDLNKLKEAARAVHEEEADADDVSPPEPSKDATVRDAMVHEFRLFRRIVRSVAHLAKIGFKWTSRQIWRLFKRLLLDEAKLRVLQLFDAGVVPKRFNIIKRMINQTYRGDITIAPITRIKLSTLKLLLSNPDDMYMVACIKAGERKTWEQISRIRTKEKIERTLEDCLEFARQQVLRDLQTRTLTLDATDSATLVASLVESRGGNPLVYSPNRLLRPAVAAPVADHISLTSTAPGDASSEEL